MATLTGTHRQVQFAKQLLQQTGLHLHAIPARLPLGDYVAGNAISILIDLRDGLHILAEEHRLGRMLKTAPDDLRMRALGRLALFAAAMTES